MGTNARNSLNFGCFIFFEIRVCMCDCVLELIQGSTQSKQFLLIYVFSEILLSLQCFMSFLSNSIGMCRLPRQLSNKEYTCQGRRHGFNPWIGKIPKGGNGNPLQYSCLENPMDRGALQAIIHGGQQRDMTEHALGHLLASCWGKGASTLESSLIVCNCK